MGLMTEREVWKEPVGVVGVIVPWNFPVEIILNKLGPVLAMGNTCVLKPAPDTPWNATRIGRLIAEKTDIPAGVVNIVTSSDHLVGEVLTTSPTSTWSPSPARPPPASGSWRRRPPP
jgi:aldehyde dehydrogenase (NAD+)